MALVCKACFQHVYLQLVVQRLAARHHKAIIKASSFGISSLIIVDAAITIARWLQLLIFYKFQA